MASKFRAVTLIVGHDLDRAGNLVSNWFATSKWGSEVPKPQKRIPTIFTHFASVSLTLKAKKTNSEFQRFNFERAHDAAKLRGFPHFGCTLPFGGTDSHFLGDQSITDTCDEWVLPACQLTPAKYVWLRSDFSRSAYLLVSFLRGRVTLTP